MWPSAAPSHKSRVVAASHLSPDQDEASDVHLLSGALLAIQLLPPSLEMKIGLGHPSGPPPAATANLVASAEEATALQSNWLDQVSLQFCAELVEVQIPPLRLTITNLAPSAEDATDDKPP